MSVADRRFQFVLGSTRRDGNTERLAHFAAKSMPAGAEVRWLRLSELTLQPFVDWRHDAPESYVMPEGDERLALDATLWATDLVLAAPTYWYNVPASVKAYLDHFSGWMRVPGLDFKASMAGKTLWVITVNSDAPNEDAGTSAPLIESLEMTAAYLGMAFGGALVGHGNRPGDVERDALALTNAARFLR